MKNLSKLFVVFALIFVGVNTTKGQSSLKDDEANKAAEVKDLINSGKYTFKATKIIQKGNYSALSSGYALDVSKDTLIANLPDAGGTSNKPDEEGIQFTSTHFNCHMATGKNGHEEITIQPTANSSGDMKDVRKLKLDISSLGRTTLIVSTSHGPVSYYGYIKQPGAEFPPLSSLR